MGPNSSPLPSELDWKEGLKLRSSVLGPCSGGSQAP